MKNTWAYWSERVLGYVATQTPKTEYYVALHKIQHHLNQGYDERDIAQIWNTGRAGACIRGVNRWGVRYDSCAYEKKFVLALNR